MGNVFNVFTSFKKFFTQLSTQKPKSQTIPTITVTSHSTSVILTSNFSGKRSKI